jgi:hypothetical protein
MAIIVKHSGNVAPTLAGAYRGGQGKREAEDSRQRLEIAARAEEATRQRNFQERQAVLQRRFQRQEAAASRRYDATQRDLDRTWRADQSELADERAITRQRLAHDLGLDAQEHQMGLRNELAENEQMRRREDIEWNYTTKQRQDIQRTFDALAEAQESGNFTDDEMQELQKQAYTKLAGVGPLPSIQKRSPYPEGQAPGEIWNSDDGNFLLTRDDKGNIKKLGESKTVPTYNDKIGAWKVAVELAKSPILTSKGVDTGQTKVDYRAKEIVEEILGQQFGGADAEAVEQWGVGRTNSAGDDEKQRTGASRWEIR